MSFAGSSSGGASMRKRSMTRNSTILLAVIVGSVFVALAQGGGQDFTYTIATTQAWTDTGLDLQAGDSLQISASSAGCDPRGAGGGSAMGPLASAPAGALVARLHAQGSAPVLIGAGRELRITEPSHLFLGVNASGAPLCQGSFAVKVRRAALGARATSGAASWLAKAEALATSNSAEPSSSSASTASSDAATDSKSRGEQLKSQLGAAAEVFAQGQFGLGEAAGGSAATAIPALKISDVQLDADLRRDIDSLPRRVNDQFKNLGDMVNFVIVGSQKDVQAALDAANWHPADVGDSKAVFNALMETYQNKDYLQMPMSTLYLFGRPQDYGYEMAEPIAMVASRHHFRIWKAPFTWKGQEVWVGAGTHDIGFAKDKRNGNVTHKIDPKVDGERDNIGSSLQKADKAKILTYYLPPDPVQEAKNATGDRYESDGRLLVVLLQ